MAKLTLLTEIPDKVNIVDSDPRLLGHGVIFDRTMVYDSPEFLKYISALRDGFLAENSTFYGGSRTIGTGLFGGGVSISRDLVLSSEALSVEVTANAYGLGFSAAFKTDQTGKLIPGSLKGSAGLQVILGRQTEVLGVAWGATTEARVGVFFNEKGLQAGADVKYSVGLVAGTSEVNDEIKTILYSREEVDEFVTQLKSNSAEKLKKNEVVECFAAGTPIDLADGTQKPIEDIRIGDTVMAYDPNAENGRGAVRPSKVTQTHLTPNRIVLDFWGTKVTPGHVFLCGDGPYVGQHRMLMDIIRDDGALVRADGTVVRAATNCPVGGEGDTWLNVHWAVDETTPMTAGRIRAGTPFPRAKDGRTFLDVLRDNGYDILPDGNIVKTGEIPHPLYYLGRLPRPEDYILKRSGVTLEELYSEDSSLTGEQSGIPAPAIVGDGSVTEVPSAGPLQIAGNRHQRRRQKAQQRKRGGETFH